MITTDFKRCLQRYTPKMKKKMKRDTLGSLPFKGPGYLCLLQPPRGGLPAAMEAHKVAEGDPFPPLAHFSACRGCCICSSPQTEGIQKALEACPWHGVTYNPPKYFSRFHVIFPWFLLFFCKIPWFFQVFQVYSHFSRYSSKCGNPASPDKGGYPIQWGYHRVPPISHMGYPQSAGWGYPPPGCCVIISRHRSDAGGKYKREVWRKLYFWILRNVTFKGTSEPAIMDPFSGEEGGVREVRDTCGDCSTGPRPGLRFTRSVSTSAATRTKFDGYLIRVPAEKKRQQ